MEQSINLTSIGNARELGGFSVGDAVVKHGVLLRTASLTSISDEDMDRLTKVYHLYAVIDLRMSSERKHAPDMDIPGVENLFFPVVELEDYEDGGVQMGRALADPDVDRFEIMKIAVQAGMLDEHLYERFLFSDSGKKAYRDMFATLLELPEGRSVLWHCTDGKDRAGVASMLVLAALGADRDTILRDYMLTNEYNKTKIDKHREVLRGSPLTPEYREIAMFGYGAVYEKYMINALTAMEDRYGSTTGYISEELGVGEPELEELHRKFC
ncbi:MAG: tyrosine-protein phosphatase [Eubacterium sp.]|nr:tyrosine-protein phosphatase [Eubacterium sp.]